MWIEDLKTMGFYGSAETTWLHLVCCLKDIVSAGVHVQRFAFCMEL